MNPALALSIAHQESGFDPAAKSPTGVVGLFQVTNDTGKRYGQTPESRTDPQVSTQAGLHYFKDLLTETGGNIPKALQRYNGGGDPDYVRHVMQWYPDHAAALARPVGHAPSWLSTTGEWFSPASAEAASVQPESLIDAGAILDRLYGAPSTPSPDTATPAEAAQAVQLRRDVYTPQEPGPAPLPADGGEVPVDPQTGVARINVNVAKASGALGTAGVTPGPPSAASQPGATHSVGIPGFEGLQFAPSSSPQQEGTSAGVASIPKPMRDAAAMGLSTAGAMGGAALGTLTSPVTGPVGPIAGEAAGSYAARWLNVKLGLEEPGTLGDVLSVAVPVGARTLVPAGKAFIRQLPGASGIGHEMAQQALEQVPQRFAPPLASEALWQQAAQYRAPIVTTTLRKEARAIINHEMGLDAAYRTGPALEAAQGLFRLERQYGSQVPLDVLNQYRERLGVMVGQASEHNWPELAGLKKLYGAVMTDIEGAAARGVPGADVLTQAIGATRQEKALDELAQLWGPGRGITHVGEGNILQVSGKRILNQFDKMVASDPQFAGSFTAQEQQAIRETLQDVARMTASAPTSKGSMGQVLQWTGRALGIGTAAHGDPLLGAAIEVGAEGAPYVIAAALRNPVGRAAVREAFRQGEGHLTPAGLALINQAVREQTSAGARS